MPFATCKWACPSVRLSVFQEFYQDNLCCVPRITTLSLQSTGRNICERYLVVTGGENKAIEYTHFFFISGYLLVHP